MKTPIPGFLILLVAGIALGQQLDNSSLTGDYGFIQMAADVGGDGALAAVRTIGGVLSFDGAGGFTFDAQSAMGAGTLQAAAGSGSYEVESSGMLTLTNPLSGGTFINARLGAGAEALAGSTTEVQSATVDFFAAVKLPSGATDALAAGDYAASSLSLPGGSASQASSALIEFSSDGSGELTAMQASGHSAASRDRPVAESVDGSTYSLTTNGSGALAVGAGSTLIDGGFDIFVSETGNYVLGHSNAAGGRSILAAVRRPSGGSSDADFFGNFWFAEFNLELDRGKCVAAVGGLTADGAGRARTAQRIHEATAAGSGTFDAGLLLFSDVDSGGTGRLGFLQNLSGDNFGLGAPSRSAAGSARNGFVSAQVNNRLLSRIHGISFGIRMPAVQPDGDVFLAPQGVLNAGAFAPVTYPLSPGAMLSLFGSGLAPATVFADTTPLPTSLAGVSVAVNGVPSPLFFVSAIQINLQTPFSLNGDRASIEVNNNGRLSNEVSIPVSATSPGVFSIDQNGLGHGIVTHAADFTAVNESSPAAPDEVVIIFLTGLGAVDPASPEGEPAPGAALTLDAVSVEFGGETGDVFYAGAAPGFVGLYQINVRTPNPVFSGPAVPLAISTGNAFIDYVDIAIGL